MSNKSPFAKSFLQVQFVWGPAGDQHIFVKDDARSMCGKTGQDIHAGPEGTADVTTSKTRHPDRATCAKCEKKWKNHPKSPWKAWAQKVKV